MPNKMLIDASHPEETRVVVTRGNRIEEFDFESSDKKQLRGNIYLARVTRVEPSLQAAFVEYGGNRHGFLAFSEIHPDYYQIPLADRQALLKADAEHDAHEEEEDEEKARGKRRRGGKNRSRNSSNSQRGGASAAPEAVAEVDEPAEIVEIEDLPDAGDAGQELGDAGPEAGETAEVEEIAADTPDDDDGDDGTAGPRTIAAAVDSETISETQQEALGRNADADHDEEAAAEEHVESVGAEDALEELPSRRSAPRRQYKIQEVIKRRQILLVQVVKEERGNKGAALTTYLSLAGRYSVLMPNTARGGGISRKITSAVDRKRLKELVQDLDVPQGMGVILRTAGANRTKAEIKRDYEYLMRMWETVRTSTLQSTAPALVYEEGSLIKRSVRDLYNKDIGEILVAGDEGYREAKDFMRMLMPSHAKVVQPYRDVVPIFARNGIEAQLDRMLQPQVTLKSGGYIIINQTEALVSIDVNSGRSTREHSIEETALHTNLEAAEEVARQLRLRDLAGLVVIDFIDMEHNSNIRKVEKAMKEALKNDRARIQVGRISHFGLLEMSRQRIRASVLESTMKPCPHCGGTGHIRSDSSVALHVIRAIEEFLIKDARNHITVRTPAATALYVLNHKRRNLSELEERFGLTISLEADETLGNQLYSITRGAPVEKPVITTITDVPMAVPTDEDDADHEIVGVEEEEEVESAAHAEGSSDEEGRNRRRKRRRRRRGGRDRENGDAQPANGIEQDASAAEDGDDEDGEDDGDAVATAQTTDAQTAEDGERRKRRRGKRGGRRNRREDESDASDSAEAAADGDSGEIIAEIAEETPAPVEEAVAEPASEPAAEPVTSTPAVEAPAVEEPAVEAAPAKKTRARKPRASKAKPAEEVVEAVAETPVAIEIVEEMPAPTETEAAAPRRAARRRSDDEAPAAPAEPKVISTLSSESAPQEQPKKGGWWQRKTIF